MTFGNPSKEPTSPPYERNGVAETREAENPVVESARFVLKRTDIVTLDEAVIVDAAKYIRARLLAEGFAPWSWRDQPLHLVPPHPNTPGYDAATDVQARSMLDWLFLISSLNFSFWSELPEEKRYAVEWREGWDCSGKTVRWTGYRGLLAAINRALDEGIPITDPAFYSSESRCPDRLIEDVFRSAPGCEEGIPLLRQRIQIMRENGSILCERFGGSFQSFIGTFMEKHRGRGTALQLVQMVTDTFPSFRDACQFEGRTVYFWKRAQILVAETWAAFHPIPVAADREQAPHPFLPLGVGQLTMFADYRVPQILHHMRILTYPPSLVGILERGEDVQHGSKEEMSVRAASILAVEGIRDEMLRLSRSATPLSECEGNGNGNAAAEVEVSSVLIDFYLWDFAKRIEEGVDSAEGVDTRKVLPPHRTRSIWY